MKKALICLSLVAALALTACGGGTESAAPTATPEATPESTPLPDDILNQPATPPEGGVDDGMAVTPGNDTAAEPDSELSGMVDTIYEAYPVELMMMTSSAVNLGDESWCTYNTGLTAEQAALVDAGVLSESMTGSQAYSLVLLRVKDEADAQTIADAVLNNIQMNKWVCTMADKARVATFGDKVLFVMSNSELADVDALMDAAAEALGVTFDYGQSKTAEM
ncbi:MAG TPA: DUF4358 domain-containing protein [Candidatus Gemmiger excrementavium]|uniref:DUF4358 domain-containing protein n=1 Tax=Candidatus Gemmiger excrementavium TaxID=2838608 RepID=A0A9D2F304_9FIRM|nr:DUF4358 domain-containing protein [Candidatus Gemmiger excrementavium]